jgi:hypothetical protein
MAGQPVSRAREGRLPASGARGYSWAPFEAGNLVALRHGMYSRQVTTSLAEQLVDDLLGREPDLAHPRYRAEVSAWAIAEARAALALALLEQFDFDDERWERADKEWRGASDRAAKGRAKLGLNPRDHAALVHERASAEHSVVDLDEIRRRGREALEARGLDRDGAA